MYNDVLVIGDALIDRRYSIKKLPSPGGDEAILEATEKAGGSALNSACILAARGLKTVFLGVVGEDSNGALLCKYMKEAGVDISLLRQCGTTGYTITFVDEQAERTMFSYRGACAFVQTLNCDIRNAIQQSKLLALSGYLLLDPCQADFALHAALHARACGVTVFLDASPIIGNVDKAILQDVLGVTDIFSPNRMEFAICTKYEDEGACFLSAVPCLAVKLGADGSLLKMKAGFPLMGGTFSKEALHITEPSSELVLSDSTGAGDAFNAGFIEAYLKGKEPREWLRTANTVAGEYCHTNVAGAGPALPHQCV